MKKVLIVLAFVAVYGVSLAMTQATPMVSVDEIVVVDDNVEKEEGKKAAKTKAKGEKPAEGCSGAKADAKACSETATKKAACSDEKSTAKKACGSSCGGK